MALILFKIAVTLILSSIPGCIFQDILGTYKHGINDKMNGWDYFAALGMICVIVSVPIFVFSGIFWLCDICSCKL